MWLHSLLVVIFSVVFCLSANGQDNYLSEQNEDSYESANGIASTRFDPLSLSSYTGSSDPEVRYYIGNALLISEIKCQNVKKSDEYIESAANSGHAGALLHLYEKARRNGNQDDAKNYLVRAAAQNSPLVGRDFSLEAKYKLWRYAEELLEPDLKIDALNELLIQVNEFPISPLIGLESMEIRFEVAKLHFNREQPIFNIRLGLNLLSKLAKHGHPNSISLLDDFKYIGLNEESDFDSFKNSVLLKAKEGDGKASHAVYILFFLGAITADEARTFVDVSQENVIEQLLLYAAEAGSSRAAFRLSMYYQRNNASLEQAKIHRTRALASELPKALYQEGLDIIRRNPLDTEAHAHFLRAAELGSQQARAAIAIECLAANPQFECAENSNEYENHLRELAFRDRDYTASYFLGERYKHNIRGETKAIQLNYKDSFVALSIAANSGNLKAYREIADSYNRGIGTVQSEKHALIWLVKGYLRSRSTRQPIPKSASVPSVPDAINALLDKANICEVKTNPCDESLENCGAKDGRN